MSNFRMLKELPLLIYGPKSSDNVSRLDTIPKVQRWAIWSPSVSRFQYKPLVKSHLKILIRLTGSASRISLCINTLNPHRLQTLRFFQPRPCYNLNILAAASREIWTRQSASLDKFSEGIAFISLNCGVLLLETVSIPYYFAAFPFTKHETGVLITCSMMQQSDLQGTCMKVNTEPSQAGASGKILVSYGEAVMWSLTTKECPTWFVSTASHQSMKSKVANFWRDLHCALSCFLAPMYRILAQGSPSFSEKLGQSIKTGRGATR